MGTRQSAKIHRTGVRKPPARQSQQRASGFQNPLADLQAASSDPSALRPESILAMQQTLGNQAVQRLIDTRRRKTPVQENTSLDSGINQQIQSARGGGQRLPTGFRERVEQQLGQDLGEVRLHTDGKADTLSRSLHATAFTVGRDIFFRRGSYQPNSNRGRETLLHELTHTVQQAKRSNSGRLKLGPVDDTYERQADRTARRGGKAAVDLSAGAAPGAVIQRKKRMDEEGNVIEEEDTSKQQQTSSTQDILKQALTKRRRMIAPEEFEQEDTTKDILKEALQKRRRMIAPEEFEEEETEPTPKKHTPPNRPLPPTPTKKHAPPKKPLPPIPTKPEQTTTTTPTPTPKTGVKEKLKGAFSKLGEKLSSAKDWTGEKLHGAKEKIKGTLGMETEEDKAKKAKWKEEFPFADMLTEGEEPEKSTKEKIVGAIKGAPGKIKGKLKEVWSGPEQKPHFTPQKYQTRSYEGKSPEERRRARHQRARGMYQAKRSATKERWEALQAEKESGVMGKIKAKVKGTATRVASKVKTKAMEGYGKIKGGASKLYEKAKPKLSALGSKIKTGASDLGEKIKELPGKIKGLLSKKKAPEPEKPKETPALKRPLPTPPKKPLPPIPLQAHLKKELAKRRQMIAPEEEEEETTPQVSLQTHLKQELAKRRQMIAPEEEEEEEEV